MSVSFTIKECPAEIKQVLAGSAKRQRRSQNSEAIRWLEEQARTLSPRVSEKELLRRIRSIAWRTRLTPEEQTALRSGGRP
jgi:hypothetical protein